MQIVLSTITSFLYFLTGPFNLFPLLMVLPSLPHHSPTPSPVIYFFEALHTPVDMDMAEIIWPLHHLPCLCSMTFVRNAGQHQCLLQCISDPRNNEQYWPSCSKCSTLYLYPVQAHTLAVSTRLQRLA